MDISLARLGPRRCLVLCSRDKFDRHSGNDEYFIRMVVESASGVYAKVFHIGTRKAWRRVSILFDYDNPDHHDSDVLAFRIKKRTVPIPLRPNMVIDVHNQARRWLEDHKRYGSILPIRTEVCFAFHHLIILCANRLTSLKLIPNSNLSDPDDLNSLSKPASAETTTLSMSSNMVDSKVSKSSDEDKKEEE